MIAQLCACRIDCEDVVNEDEGLYDAIMKKMGIVHF